MKQLKNLALSAAATGAFALSAAANAAVVDISPGSALLIGGGSGFCDTGDTYRTGFYAYTCYTGGATDPAAGHMAVNTLPATALAIITEQTIGGVAVGTLQIANLGSGFDAGQLSYFVELLPPPGFTPDDEPDLRFTNIRLTNEILQDGDPDNVLTTKQITGQNTSVVSDASFTAFLSAGVQEDDEAFCGVCRKFAVTDTIDNSVNPGQAGVTQSMTNTFRTALPVPAPLALVAAGLLGLGAMKRRRKA
jgi:hypothetical protein